MNLQSIVVVLLRVVSLNFLVEILVRSGPQIVQFGYPAGSIYSIFLWGWLVFCIMAAILLWVLAPGIARLMTSGTSQEISLGPLSLADCYSIALIATGLYLAAGHLSGVLYWTGYTLIEAARTPTDSWKQAVNGYSVWQSFGPFIIGIVVLVKSRKWAVALSRRDAGAGSVSSPPGEKQV